MLRIEEIQTSRLLSSISQNKLAGHSKLQTTKGLKKC